MVLELGLAKSPRFETSLCNFICLFESLRRIMFGLFDSLHAGMGLHVREGIRSMMFILNLNSTNLSFLIGKKKK